jgi:hypothetical protein
MRFSVFGYWGVPAVAGVAVLFAVAAVARLAPGQTWVQASVMSAVVVAGCALAFSAYRFADEVILQMHKTAWFWGGWAGIIVFVPISIFVGWHLVPLPLTVPNVGDARGAYFAEGGALVIVLQTVGFLVVLACQRLWRPKK